MKVKATAPGYHGLSMKVVGEEFEIQEAVEFSHKWMELVGEAPASWKPQLEANKEKVDAMTKIIGEEKGIGIEADPVPPTLSQAQKSKGKGKGKGKGQGLNVI